MQDKTGDSMNNSASSDSIPENSEMGNPEMQRETEDVGKNDDHTISKLSLIHISEPTRP